MFPLWAVMLIIGCVISAVVFFTSRNHTPPVYHGVCSSISVLAQITLLYKMTEFFCSWVRKSFLFFLTTFQRNFNGSVSFLWIIVIIQIFAYLGFVVSVIWIYIVANEIVNLVTMYGVLLNVSNVIMGLTFLAWGNSIGDVVADYTLAKQGHPRMSLSACFGGPLFSKFIHHDKLLFF